MAAAVTSVLFTRDRRVFLEDDCGTIREASTTERLRALADLLITSQTAHAESDG
jgi:hypothetical protein